MNEYDYMEYDCMRCIYGSLSVDDFPCNVCYEGEMYDLGENEDEDD